MSEPRTDPEARRLREALAEAGQKIDGLERQLLVAETRARAAEQASTGRKAEIEQLREALAAVRGIHAPRSEQNADLSVQRTLCPECLAYWPCDTARAVGVGWEEKDDADD